MTALSNSWLYQGGCMGSLVPHYGVHIGKSGSHIFQVPPIFRPKRCLRRKEEMFHQITCVKKDGEFDPSSVEQPPYHVYYDSTSGQLEPASGARASIPSQEYWPEGTVSRVRAARAPEPVGESEGKPSYGKNPGSRRKRYQGNAAASEITETSADLGDTLVLENSDDVSDEVRDSFVVYETEEEDEDLSSYELDKRLGHPHPFIDPAKDKPIEEIRSSQELWWNWRKPEKDLWSRWQRRRPDVDTVFAKAMAETGQIKLYGDYPTLAEASIARTRKHVFKEERLQAEQTRLEEIGPVAYYSEWVEAWNRDTSLEAVQKHYEETGEDENIQLITMFQHQTAGEYRIMMGTDVRIKRDPLAMRMSEDLKKEIYGGDPVYPTINYVQDPDEVNDYRGANFHEPHPDVVDLLMKQGDIISREELDQILAEENKEELEVSDIDEAMATAVDIGENDDEEDTEDEEVAKEDQVEEKVNPDDSEDEETAKEDQVEEKANRYWSVLKTTPELRKSKEKPKKEGSMTLQEAIDDSENITDFLMDFDEEE